MVTSAATFITHFFMVKGLQVGLSSVKNKNFKLVLEPLLISIVRSWPKFIIRMIGFFVSISYIGDFSVVGSIGFNLHITFAAVLFALKNSQLRLPCVSIACNLLVLLIAFAFNYLIRNTTFLVSTFLILACTAFYGFVGFFPLFVENVKSTEDADKYEMGRMNKEKNETRKSCLFLEKPKR